MRAVRCHEWGAPDVLAVDNIEVRRPGPGEVRIRVEASAVNFTDTLIVAGKYQFKPKLPHVPGHELAGVVLEVGEGVTECAVGDRVMASARQGGGFAEEYVGVADKVYRIPAQYEFRGGSRIHHRLRHCLFRAQVSRHAAARRNAAGQWRSRRCRAGGDSGRQGAWRARGCVRLHAGQDCTRRIIWRRLLHQLRERKRSRQGSGVHRREGRRRGVRSRRRRSLRAGDADGRLACSHADRRICLRDVAADSGQYRAGEEYLGDQRVVGRRA